MSKVVETRTIDGHSFVITKLPVEDSLKVLIWLTKSVGGTVTKSLGQLSSFSKLKDDEEFDMSKLSGVLDNCFERIDEKETLEKIGILLSCVSKDAQNLHFQSPVLQGEPLLAMKLAKESLGVNFKSFLGGISGVVEKVKKSVAIMREERK